MKRLFLLMLLLGRCVICLAQFRESPSATARRQSELETHVEGNLRKVLALSVDRRVVALTFSPKGDFLAVATATSLSLWSESGAHKMLWDGAREPRALFQDRPPVRAVLTFSNDGKRLFFCGAQGLSVWSWPDGVSLEHPCVRGWTAPDVYNVALADEPNAKTSGADGERIVCAAKRGSSQFVQLRRESDGKPVWEEASGLLPVTSLQRHGVAVRSIVGNATGSQCFWSDYNLSDGKRSLPVDLGTANGFSASQSPDGRLVAVVRGELGLVNFDTGETKMAVAPFHSFLDVYPYYWRDYTYYSDEWPYTFYRWPYGSTVDTGWTTLFSPDGDTVVTIGKEAVFYDRGTGIITGRIFYSGNPFPRPYLPFEAVQSECDGVGGFSPNGQKFALVHQARVVYSFVNGAGNGLARIQRQVQGNSAVEIYAVGVE